MRGAHVIHARGSWRGIAAPVCTPTVTKLVEKGALNADGTRDAKPVTLVNYAATTSPNPEKVTCQRCQAAIARR